MRFRSSNHPDTTSLSSAKHVTVNHVNEAALWALSACRQGEPSSPRGMPTKEIFGSSFTLSNPRARVLSIVGRRWNHALAIGELCWHLRQSDDVESLAHYAHIWRDFADDSLTIRGSCYGKKIFSNSPSRPSRWSIALNLLKDDPDTRRAIVTVGGFDDDHPELSNDVSCVQSLHFFIRNNKLNIYVHMRSNDAFIGLPYDVYLLTFFQELMALELGVELGTYLHFADSLHLYLRDEERASSIGRLPEKKSCMPAIIDPAEVWALVEFEEKFRQRGVASKLPISQPWKGMADTLVAFGGRLNRGAAERTSARPASAPPR